MPRMVFVFPVPGGPWMMHTSCDPSAARTRSRTRPAKKGFSVQANFFHRNCAGVARGLRLVATSPGTIAGL